MTNSSKLVHRLTGIVHTRNRELLVDAGIKAALGIAFSFFTFGILYWFGWVLGFAFAYRLNLEAWQFGAIFSGTFFVAAIWSAWRRVDPLADLAPPNAAQDIIRLITHAAGGVYFSPRYATAGAALVLLGGPANVFEALGIWAHRLCVEPGSVEAAARLLEECDPPLPFDRIRDLQAAVLLKRLALVKAVPHGESHALTLTDKGRGNLAKRNSSPTRRPPERGESA